jgi:hypothetical protein
MLIQKFLLLFLPFPTISTYLPAKQRLKSKKYGTDGREIITVIYFPSCLVLS